MKKWSTIVISLWWRAWRGVQTDRRSALCTRMVSFSPSSLLLNSNCEAAGAVIMGSVDGNRIWGKELKGTALTDVEFSPDGQLLLFSLKSGEVHVYDAQGSFMVRAHFICWVKFADWKKIILMNSHQTKYCIDCKKISANENLMWYVEESNDFWKFNLTVFSRKKILNAAGLTELPDKWLGQF